MYEVVLTLFVLSGSFILFILKESQPYSYLTSAFVIFEYILLSIFFRNLYKGKNAKKTSIFGVILFLIILFLIFKFDLNNVSSIIVIECLFLIISALYYFFEKIKNVGTIPIHHSISFWIVVGILIYASGNIFSFVYLESMTKNSENLKQLRYIYSFVTISKNIIFSLGILFGSEVIFKENSFTIPEDINLDDFSIPKNDNPTS